MVSEEYFTMQAKAFLELLPSSHKKPLSQKTAGMMNGEKGTLLYLSNHEDVTAGELSRALEIGSGGVANVLNALESKGLIQRTQSPLDRRKVIVSLSDEGRAVIEKHKAEALDVTALLLSRLGKEDTEQLLRIFKRLVAIGDELCTEKTEEQKPCGN